MLHTSFHEALEPEEEVKGIINYLIQPKLLTTLQEDHPRIIAAKFGQNPKSSLGGKNVDDRHRVITIAHHVQLCALIS